MLGLTWTFHSLGVGNAFGNMKIDILTRPTKLSLRMTRCCGTSWCYHQARSQTVHLRLGDRYTKNLHAALAYQTCVLEQLSKRDMLFNVCG